MLELKNGRQAQIESVATGLGIDLNSSSLDKSSAPIGYRADAGCNGRDNVIANLIASPTDCWTKGHNKIISAGSPCFQVVHRRGKDAGCDTSPSGVAGRGVTGRGIGDQHRSAICAAHPQALATSVADKAVCFRPGGAAGLVCLENDAAVNLLRPMNTGADADIPRQFLRIPSAPEAGEETMLEAMLGECVCLEVIAAVAADPGPTVQHVEPTVRSIERAWPRLCSSRFIHSVAMSRIIQNPAKACSSGLA